MSNTEKFTFNLCAGIHNLGMVSEAKKLLQGFVNEGEGIVYIYNKDGSWIKLEPGFEIVAVDGLGITKEED